MTSASRSARGRAGSRARGRLLLELDRAGVRRGERTVLSDVTWRVRDGEFWAVLGPNGSGKSTLLAALRGEARLAQGELRFGWSSGAAAEASDPSAEVHRVAFSDQLAALGNASGFHQSRWHAGEDAAVLRADQFLSKWGAAGRRAATMLGLGTALGRRVTELSNGERRKLLLAEAAASRPRLLVLDNPFTGLDGPSRRDLLDALRRLLARRLRLIVTVARPEEVPRSATHVLLLARGRVVASGRRSAVLRPAILAPVFDASRARDRRSSGPRRPLGRAGRAVVEMRDARVRYAGKRIIDGVSWTVRRGERWAVLGPNGAGKTTLLSLIVGDNPQVFANEVRLFGRARGGALTLRELRRKIGFVSPELHLHHPGRVTALEAVASGLHDSVGLYRRCTPGELRRARALLERLGLGRSAPTPFRELSEGEQRLILLARALVKAPELLVLDEPCQGLDPSTRRAFLAFLEAMLRRHDLTLIQVAHEVEDFPHGMTHALLLESGRVEMEGDAGTVIRAWERDHPGHRASRRAR